MVYIHFNVTDSIFFLLDVIFVLCLKEIFPYSEVTDKTIFAFFLDF